MNQELWASYLHVKQLSKRIGQDQQADRVRKDSLSEKLQDTLMVMMNPYLDGKDFQTMWKDVHAEEAYPDLDGIGSSSDGDSMGALTDSDSPTRRLARDDYYQRRKALQRARKAFDSWRAKRKQLGTNLAIDVQSDPFEEGRQCTRRLVEAEDAYSCAASLAGRLHAVPKDDLSLHWHDHDDPPAHNGSPGLSVDPTRAWGSLADRVNGWQEKESVYYDAGTGSEVSGLSSPPFARSEDWFRADRTRKLIEVWSQECVDWLKNRRLDWQYENIDRPPTPLPDPGYQAIDIATQTSIAAVAEPRKRCSTLSSLGSWTTAAEVRHRKEGPVADGRPGSSSSPHSWMTAATCSETVQEVDVRARGERRVERWRGWRCVVN